MGARDDRIIDAEFTVIDRPKKPIRWRAALACQIALGLVLGHAEPPVTSIAFWVICSVMLYCFWTWNRALIKALTGWVTEEQAEALRRRVTRASAPGGPSHSTETPQRD